MKKSSIFTAAVIGTLLVAAASALFLRATSTPGQSIPDGLALVPTATPDLSRAIPIDEALNQLRTDPRVSPVVAAIEAGDVDGLLALIDWQPKLCTEAGARGDSEQCGAEQDASAPVPMTDVGDFYTQWVTEQTLRPYLEVILHPKGSLSLTYVARSDADEARLYVAFEGLPKGKNFPPIGSGDSQLAGLFLTLDAKSPRPIAKLLTVLDSYDSSARSNDARQADSQSIIARADPQ